MHFGRLSRAMLFTMFSTQGSDAGAVTAAVIWDGIAGAGLAAIVGGVVSALVAFWVVRLTQRGTRQAALESESRAAAGQLTVGLIELRHNAGLLGKEGTTREQREEQRRELGTEAGQVFNLNGPALQEATLRRDAEVVHKAMLEFLTLSGERDLRQAGRPGARRARFDPWHREAHQALGRSVSGLVERLKAHRLGQHVPAEPLPEPELPTVSEVNDVAAGVQSQ